MGDIGAARRLVATSGGLVRAAPRYRRDLAVAGVVELAGLAVLATYFQLGLAAWLVGIAFVLVGGALLATAFERAGARALSPADRVTLTRLTLIGWVSVLVVDRIGESAPMLMIVLATVALILDGVDGKVARRTGTASDFGARYDIEADSVLVLALSIFVAASVGLWVLAIGLIRYAYVVASWVLPWLNAPLRPSYLRKVVAVVQAVVLIVASTDLLPTQVETGVVALSLATLCCSFWESLWWQWRTGRNRRP
jgi:phosphatidylglycerophosphate synthase